MECFMDHIDKAILIELQKNSDRPINEIAESVGMSTTPCWRRVKKLEKDGIIKKRVALVNPESINLSVTVYVTIKALSHNEIWINKFCNGIKKIPEVVECHRMSGDIDYLLKVMISTISDYDVIYKKLINIVDINDISSSFSMEVIKCTSELPTNYIKSKESA